jgi:hypothetical protein
MQIFYLDAGKVVLMSCCEINTDMIRLVHSSEKVPCSIVYLESASTPLKTILLNGRTRDVGETVHNYFTHFGANDANIKHPWLWLALLSLQYIVQVKALNDAIASMMEPQHGVGVSNDLDEYTRWKLEPWVPSVDNPITYRLSCRRDYPALYALRSTSYLCLPPAATVSACLVSLSIFCSQKGGRSHPNCW